MPDNQPADPNKPINDAAARLNAEAELFKAQAARIKALGLPSYEGKTTLKDGAGAIEGLILATDALFEAAALIAEAAGLVNRPESGPHEGPFLILAGADEQIDFGLATSMRIEMDAFAEIFGPLAPAKPVQPTAMATLGTSVAAIGAIAGLLRTDTEISGQSFAELSHRTLATATAGKLGRRAILPSAAIGPVAGSELVAALMQLIALRDAIAATKGADPGVATIIARFDDFYTRVMTADGTGQVPLAKAARLEQFLGENPLVLRVFVEKAGGSLTTRRNLWTFFSDPVKASAGLVASYTITDPSTGRVLAADVLNCRTGEASLGEIQRGETPFSARVSSSGRGDAHALRIGPRPMLSLAAGTSSMPNYFDVAGETIRDTVPDENRNNWPDVTPKTSLGMGENQWENLLVEIKDEFNRRIAPRRLKPSETFQGSWGKPLADLQWRLSGAVQ